MSHNANDILKEMKNIEEYILKGMSQLSPEDVDKMNRLKKDCESMSKEELLDTLSGLHKQV